MNAFLPPGGLSASISSDTRKRSVPLAAFSGWARWTILLAAALVVRALALGNPIVHVDEEFYFVTAQRMLQGALPFVDIWDRKPIGLFLLYLPAAALGVPLGIWVYQAMALACAVGTAWLIARLAERAGWSRGALPAALLYLFMLGFGDGQGGQSPIFYNLLVVGAIALVVPRPNERSNDGARVRRACAAMALVGISLQIKYSVLFEGAFLGVWLLWHEWRLKTPPAVIALRGAAYCTLAWLPTILAGVAYLALGHGGDWAYANFGSILDRLSDPAIDLVRAFLKVCLILGLPLILSGLSTRLPEGDATQARVRHLLFGWLIASVVGLLVFGSWFNHYALPVMVPACLCCAGYFGNTAFGRKVAVPVMLAASLFGGSYTIWSAKWHRGNGAQLEALAAGIGNGPGCMYVHSGNSMLYAYTGRCTVTAWIFPSHLARERENGAIGVDQIEEVDRIFAKMPEIVVMRPQFGGERIAVRAQVMRRMAERGYRLKGRWPLGDQMLSVYERAAVTGSAAPRLAATSSE